METIIYQGQPVQAQLVNYIDGDYTTSTAQDHAGHEELLRDEAGRYYLRQRIDAVFPQGSGKPEHRLDASGRTRVHRLSTPAAILWAATRLNSVTADLRADAANLLTEGRISFDPEERVALHQEAQPAKRAGTTPSKGDCKGALATLDASAETVTVPLALPAKLYRAVLAMGEYDGQEGFSATVAASMRGDVQSWLEAEDERIPADFLLQWLEDHPEPAQPPVPVATERGDGTTRLEFTYGPTPEDMGGTMELFVDAEQMAQAEKLAGHFCLGARQFLALLSLNHLPGQPGDDGAALRAEHVTFACKDKGQLRRLRRAVKAAGSSLEGLVAEAVSSFVTMYEESMIVHPRTGRLLHADSTELFTRGKHEITAAPLGREHEPSWQRTLHRQHVQFSAHLTPEQMERLEYPHYVTERATDREVPCVLIPYDSEEGLPFLTVNGQDVPPSQSIPAAETQQMLPVHMALASMAASLDTHAFGLLCTYLGENPDDDPRDVVNGYLASMLECELFDRSRRAAEPLAEARARRLAHEASRGRNKATMMIPVFTTEQLSQIGREGLAKGVA